MNSRNWFQRHIYNWEWDEGGRDVSTIERFIKKYLFETWYSDGVRVIHCPWFKWNNGIIFIWGDSKVFYHSKYREIFGINLDFRKD